MLPCRGLILKPIERPYVSLLYSLPFKRSACLYVTTTGYFERFNTLTLEQVFWKTKTFLKKLEKFFLLKRTTNKSATFPYETALTKANVRTNWMGWGYKMDLSQRMGFCHWLLQFFENLIWVYKPLIYSCCHTFCKRFSRG